MSFDNSFTGSYLTFYIVYIFQLLFLFHHSGSLFSLFSCVFLCYHLINLIIFLSFLLSYLIPISCFSFLSFIYLYDECSVFNSHSLIIKIISDEEFFFSLIWGVNEFFSMKIHYALPSKKFMFHNKMIETFIHSIFFSNS
jgi:hypothetical protein